MLERRLPPVGRGYPPQVWAGASEIIAAVRKEGDMALVRYARQFDGVDLKKIEVSQATQRAALKNIPDSLKKALQQSARRVEAFCENTMPSNLAWQDGFAEFGWRWVPVEKVGVYVPGGQAAYPSSVIMGVVAAKTAGCPYISVCTPRPAEIVLAACALAEADSVFQVGGAQAIAALAYGTQTVPKVDKIVGPGGAYVDAAKRLVSRDVSIDFPAGPSELAAVAGKDASARQIALDLAAQAEHDADARVGLFALDEEILKAVEVELGGLKAERSQIMQSIKQNGFAVVAGADECARLLNQYGFEHVALYGKAAELQGRIQNAGVVYVNTPPALGDYTLGSNHVLPTGGFARSRGMLSVYDFLKPVVSAKRIRLGLEKGAATVARAEGLFAHAESMG